LSFAGPAAKLWAPDEDKESNMSQPNKESNVSKPNIVYIHSHDTGRYIQPYGYAVPTPNLQRLAEEGVLFRRAFCAQPTCSPSRGALLTGMYPHSNGLTGLAHRGFALDDYGRHILHSLRKAGYTSALSGTQHIVSGDTGRIGYDAILSDAGGPRQTNAAAVEFLTDPPSRPFLLTVGYGLTHRGFPAPGPEDDPKYVRVPEYIPDTPDNREDWAGFLTAARQLDTCMGEIFDALDRTGLAESTLVICTTDHGIAWPGMKCCLTDHGTGVMLIMRGPSGGEFTGGKVVDAMVSHIDIFPTVCDLLGIDPPAWLQGVSFLPVVRGQAEEVRKAVYAEVSFHAAYEPKRSIRTQRWKYIRRFDGRTRRVLPNVDPSAPRQLWVDNGWLDDKPVAAEQLYDLLFDPAERANLTGDPAYAEVLADLRGRLAEWMKRTGDPLVHGPMPMPAGARLNHPDDPSPREFTKPYVHPSS